jgi:hypothetical protein
MAYFAFAMTLLVIDLRLPESFHPSTSAEFIKGLEELSWQLIAYILSFLCWSFAGCGWQSFLPGWGKRARNTAIGHYSICSLSQASRSQQWSSAAMAGSPPRYGSIRPT